MPTRKRLTILRKNGDRIACATVKMTTAMMNPDALTDTPGISHAAANNPIAEDPRKIAVRKESAHGSEPMHYYSSTNTTFFSMGLRGICSRLAGKVGSG